MPGALLAEKDGAAGRGKTDADDGGQPERQGEHEQQGCHNAVGEVFEQQRPGHLRGAVKDEHELPAKNIEGGAGDGGLEKVGGDPCLHALGLAGLHGFLDFPKMHMLRGEEHARHGVLVHGGDEVADRLAGDVHAPGHLDVRALLGGHLFHELAHVVPGPGQQHALPALPMVEAAAQARALHLLPQQQGGAGHDDGEHGHRAAGHLPL